MIQDEAAAAVVGLPSRLRVHEFDTSYGCAWNEAIILGGLVRQQHDRLKSPEGEAAQAAEEAELVVIVTPEAVEG